MNNGWCLVSDGNGNRSAFRYGLGVAGGGVKGVRSY